MIESIKMVGTPIHQFNYLSEESPNKQVRNFVEKIIQWYTICIRIKLYSWRKWFWKNHLTQYY